MIVLYEKCLPKLIIKISKSLFKYLIKCLRYILKCYIVEEYAPTI